MKSRSFGAPSQTRYGRLLFIELAGFNQAYGRRRSLWKLQCDCGSVVVRSSNSVRSGNTTSCGCLGAEVRRNSVRTHGMTGTPTYISWSAMIARCGSPGASAYGKYGAQGVSVCPQWVDSFEQFLADVGARPEGKTIDRIDNAKGYEPGNVRWSTLREQAKNRRNVRFVTAFGETLCLAEWERKLGISRSAIRSRIDSGMAPELALTLRRKPK